MLELFRRVAKAIKNIMEKTRERVDMSMMIILIKMIMLGPCSKMER
jgi:hypothetical protein